ncbi:hypothetical protein JXO59_14295, partial [candidate division KSB1 bacterium]|nr:hypothetical protein [candidate division KSB1 bacterium]
MNPIDLFGISILIYLIAAVLTWLTGEQRKMVGWIALICTMLAATGILTLVVQVFSNGPATADAPLWVIPGIGSELILHVDTLSALFLGIISIMSLLVVLYALGFMRLPYYSGQSLRNFYPILMLFFAGVMCVVAVNDLFVFFIFWEVMTLSSYLLVVFKRDDRARLRAGFKYFLITHIATALMFIAAIILYTRSGSFSFAALAQAMETLRLANPNLLHLVLAFFFIGFATKAGILPMGDWLPDAYPAAPAPASAAFAGSMTKLGIYGLVRVFCDILPISNHTEIWGAIIAIFGTISIFIGTMTALVQEDSKRLLSFHVIGQMGYMFLGIGTGVYFLPSHPVLGIIGIGAGVFHLINHVSYKSCLFFNAGSVFYKVGTRDINKVGGLSRIMPLTAATTVIASLSIAGIPPFSGFSSKWLIYQATINGGITSPIFIACGIAAIFISAVTLASFIKFFSSLFYGKYADNNSRAKKGDVPLSMMIPQVFLAILCILFGIVPLFAVKIVYVAIASLLPQGFVPGIAQIYGTSSIGGLSLDLGQGVVAGWNPVIIVGVGLVCALIGYLLYRSASAPQRVNE